MAAIGEDPGAPRVRVAELQTAAGPSGAPRRAARRIERLRQLGTTLAFDPTIAPEDNMVGAGPDRYFRWGFAAVELIRSVLELAEVGRTPATVLDLPCGHGRVLRMLTAAFPEAKIHACDIMEDAVAFCAQQFGAVPIVSRERPDEVPLPTDYDLIWVGSLFTHIDVGAWMGFLRLFSEHLAPGGVLVFTTLGRTFIGESERREREPQIRDLEGFLSAYHRNGFAYQDFLATTGYGLTAVRPAWVCETLDAFPELELISYTEAGWNGRQDAVAVRKGGDRPRRPVAPAS